MRVIPRAASGLSAAPDGEARLRLLRDGRPVADRVLHAELRRVGAAPQATAVDLAVEVDVVAAGLPVVAPHAHDLTAAVDREIGVAVLGYAIDPRGARAPAAAHVVRPAQVAALR